MTDSLDMSPQDHVFRSLENIVAMVRETPDLEGIREQLAQSLENAISWEPAFEAGAATGDGKRPPRRVASFVASAEFLREALSLPEGCEIFGAEWDFAVGQVRLFAEGPMFPAVAPGQRIPAAVAVVTAGKTSDGIDTRQTTWRLTIPRSQFAGDYCG
jgi:hypothetical protein